MKMFLILLLIPLMGQARIEEKCAKELNNSGCENLKGLERFRCLDKIKNKSEVCKKEINLEKKLFRQMGNVCFQDIQIVCKAYGRNDLETCLFNDQERFWGKCRQLVNEVVRFRSTP